jgi:type 1 glutamine amidotransferase
MLRFALVLLFAILANANCAEKPLRVLLIAGGCCHDYGKQKDILKQGIEALALVQIDIVYSTNKTTRARFDLYAQPTWADGYDAVIHDECSADVKEVAYVDNVLAAHRKVPAVNLHCAMHSYRTGDDRWFRFIGLQSTSHGPQEPVAIQFIESTHPITSTLTNWVTGREELYNNVKTFETAKPLARGRQTVKARDGGTREMEHVVAWVNEFEGTRVFNTTLGHNNVTVGDSRYLELVTRGLLWACDKLKAPYLK